MISIEAVVDSLNSVYKKDYILLRSFNVHRVFKGMVEYKYGLYTKDSNLLWEYNSMANKYSEEDNFDIQDSKCLTSLFKFYGSK